MPEFPATWAGIPEATRRLLRAYLLDTKNIIGEDVDAIILYGSLARGDFLEGRSNINILIVFQNLTCLLYTSPSPRDKRQSRMPSSA